MKKLSKLIVILMFFFMILPVVVNASGGVSVSKTSLNINRGNTATFKITATNAAGRVDISSSNNGVASVNKSSEFLDKSSVTVTVSSGSVGSANITVKCTDVATYDGEVVNNTYTIKVKVTEKAVVDPGPAKSSNNNLLNFSVDGFEIVNTGDNVHYTLVVSNMTESINVVALPEDPSAKVSGAGQKILNVGDNIITIDVKAENGKVKTYSLLVTRRDDKYYLKDIDEFVLSQSDTLLLLDNDSINNDIINKLSTKGGNVNFTKMNALNTPLYTIGVDSNCTMQEGFATDVLFSTKNGIDEKTNYTDGINIVVDKKIPTCATLKVDVSNKYKDGDKLYLYKVVDGNLVKKEDFSFLNGFVSFNLDDVEEYFLSKATLDNATVGGGTEAGKKKDSAKVFKIVSIVEFVIVLGLVAFLIVLFVKKKKKEEAEELSYMSTITPATPATGTNVVGNAVNSFGTVPQATSMSGAIPALTPGVPIAATSNTVPSSVTGVAASSAGVPVNNSQVPGAPAVPGAPTANSQDGQIEIL